MWGHTWCCCCRMGVCNFVRYYTIRNLIILRNTVVDNIRCRIVSAMLGCWCDVSAFDLRRSMCRPSMIDVSTFGDRCVDLRKSMCQPWEIDLLTFEDRRSMCRPSKVDVSTLRDRSVNLRRSMIVVDLRRSVIDVKLCCYTCSKH